MPPSSPATVRAAAAPPVRAAFAATVLLSAALLFLVQPMAGKAVLPAFGGGAAVWTTVMLFFQAALLGGSALVHLATGRLPPRAAALLHLGLSVLGAALVPARPEALSTGLGPAADVLATLGAAYGPAMLAIGGNAALLQHWYARATGQEPYWLYAVSNAGSMLGLAAYPLLLEPWLPLRGQGALWLALYAACIAGLAACAALALRRDAAPRAPAAPRLSLRPAEALRWILLAAIPSSVLLGGTQHVTAQVAPLPLLWVLPLAVYLGTWIAAFAAPEAQAARGGVYLSGAMVLLVFAGVAPGVEAALPLVAILMHLLALAGAGLLCHGLLAASRPPAERLTGFYLCLSLGGALGGVVNAVLAPALLDRLLEYPLALAAACLVAPGPWGARLAPTNRALRAALAALPALLLLALVLAAHGAGAGAPEAHLLPLLRLAGVALAAAAVLLPRPALALVVLAALGAPAFLGESGAGPGSTPPRLIAADRDFYGSIRVLEADGWRRLKHGQTVHGGQWLDPARRREMGLYYHPEAGGGRIIAAMRAARTEGAPPMEAAAIGLGAGVMACYGGPDLRITFLEISPAVAAAARRHFTFLGDCGDPPVEIGDGRLLVLARPAASLDLIVLDAYSGGAVPVHTATAEAIGGYLERLRPGGALGFHVSNRYFALAPFVAAAAARHGAAALAIDTVTAEGGASWVAVTRDAALAARLAGEGWRRLDGAAVRPWEDDRWDLLRALHAAPWAPAAR